MNGEKLCRNCKYFGWDPDGAYCVHPTTLKLLPWGRTLERHSPRNAGEYCENGKEWIKNKDVSKDNV